jgi:hypothetical protein
MYSQCLLNKQPILIEINIGKKIQCSIYFFHWIFLNRNPSLEEIKQALDRFYPNLPESETSLTKNRIKKILQKENYSLLHVFSINRDKNIAETIFKAFFTGIHFTK